ncbi:hypothetical protein GCM10011346_52490 [Oceanobacillus neutriphilus]|uniref:Uncharacterized protein n=1 Tax=Oceanobacillus neutriphilus TaxID=531815 RepID=A0ABQ2P3A2_9BACI|nr:hypothetical protein GCM10011346_52490 [Oceanobacillus neutriphilus]
MVYPVKTRVILPKMLWTAAEDEEHLKQLVNSYMVRYKDYRVVEIGKYFAICERG